MLGLSSLPNAILEPLSELEVIPTVTKDVAFYPRSPKLHLYLGSNQLSRAPGPIFTIEFLTNLSLRGNQLTELPPSISRLRNLKFLNVSQNRLRYLPAELLDLILSPNGALSDGLHIHPNPFFQPEGAPRDRLFARLANQEWSGDDLNVVFQLARSPIQYCDSSGVVYSDFRFAPLPASSLHGHQIDDDNASRLLPAEWHPAILQAAPITTLEAALPDAPVMFLAADSSTSSRTPPYDSSASTGQAAAEAKLHLPAQHFARLASSSSSLVPTLFELCLRTVSRLHSSLGKMPLPVVRRRGGFQAATRMSAKSQHCLADMLPPHLPPHIRERVMDVCIATDEEALGFCTVCEVRRRRTAVEGQESRRRRNSENTGNKSVSASETQPNAVPPSQSQQSQLSPSSATAAPAITPHSTAPVVMRTSTAPVSSGSCGPAPLRPMLVPRTGWIEWFKLSSTGRGMDDRLMPVSDSEDGGAPRLFELISGAGSDGRAFEDAVPFVRRGCSWKCVPGATDDETVSERGEESSHGYGRGWLPGGFTRTWRV